MKLRARDHLVRPWRIHEVAAGFEVEDVWGLDTPGDRQDFPQLVEQVWRSLDRTPRGGARLLLAARWRLGQWLGWDDPQEGLGSRVTPLRAGLPSDLVSTGSGVPAAAGIPFSPVYELPDEWAAELANGTVHAVLHLGWVEDHDRYRGRLAVLVRPNGWRGRLYLMAIKPFRLLIYPAWIRRIERNWTFR